MQQTSTYHSLYKDTDVCRVGSRYLACHSCKWHTPNQFLLTHYLHPVKNCLTIKNKKHQEGRGDFNLFTPVILLVKFSPCCLPYNSDWALCTIFLKVAFWWPSIVRQSPQKYFVKKQIMVISKCSMNEKVTQKSQDQG